MTEYLKQAETLRKKFDSGEMSATEVHYALEALEERFSQTLPEEPGQIQTPEVNQFYEIYSDLINECHEAIEIGVKPRRGEGKLEKDLE